MPQKTGPTLAWWGLDQCGIIRVAVMAAHAAHTKADAHVHGAHGAQSAAVPAGEAVLFANLLAQMGEADQSDAGTGKGSIDPEKLLDAHAPAGNSKKIKDHADDTIGQFADLQAMPAHLAVLNAKFASAIGETAHSKHDKADKKADPVDALDAAKDAGNAKQILNRILEAKTGNSEPAKDGKKAPAETIVTADTQPLVPPAASAAAAPSVTEPAKGRNAPAKHSDAVKDVQAADAAKTAIVPSDNAAEADTKADAKAKDSKDAKVDTAKDAASQTAIADKAEALAAAADKTVRQGAASQGPQARALPLHLEAQVAASQSGNGGKTGGDGNSAHPQGQHAKIDTDTQPREDTPQAAAPTPLNNASATQSAVHTQTQTANVQPVTAQGQTQTSSPVVAASLQVAPQTAQMAAQPDIAALAVQIAAKSGDGNKQFDIRLDPQELGRVEVKLTIDDQGRAQAHLAVEKPQTLDMLQNDRGNLERALKDSGIALSQNGLNFSLKGQERQQGDNTPSFRGRSRSLAVTAAIESASAATAASTNSFVAGNARLDIHV
jgi:flagellar hook-length control protein FliK